MKVETTYEAGTPESRAAVARVRRAIAVTERLNQIPWSEAAAIRAAWTELTGQEVDDAFSLIPPVFCDHGVHLRVGREVFINQGCALLDIGGIDIGDEVMIGPKVNLLTAGHPLDPATRRRRIVAAPIVIQRGVWLGAASTVLQGVTVGADAVVAAGSVVTRDVPERTVVAGVPAVVVRSVDDA